MLAPCECDDAFCLFLARVRINPLLYSNFSGWAVGRNVRVCPSQPNVRWGSFPIPRRPKATDFRSHLKAPDLTTLDKQRGRGRAPWIPLFHYSITPSLRCPITPPLHYSISENHPGSLFPPHIPPAGSGRFVRPGGPSVTPSGRRRRRSLCSGPVTNTKILHHPRSHRFPNR